MHFYSIIAAQWAPSYPTTYHACAPKYCRPLITASSGASSNWTVRRCALAEANCRGVAPSRFGLPRAPAYRTHDVAVLLNGISHAEVTKQGWQSSSKNSKNTNTVYRSKRSTSIPDGDRNVDHDYHGCERCRGLHCRRRLQAGLRSTACIGMPEITVCGASRSSAQLAFALEAPPISFAQAMTETHARDRKAACLWLLK